MIKAKSGKETRLQRLRTRLRRAALPVALSAAAFAAPAGPASAQALPDSLKWDDNPFTWSLSEDLFRETGEYRFEKAVRVFEEAGGGIPSELLDIFTYPLQDPWTFGLAAAGVAALTLVDVPTTTFYQENIVPIGERFDLPNLDLLPFISPDGEYILAGIGGTYVYGLAANDERAQVAAILATKAVAYSYLTSHLILKPLFGRSRPVKDLANHTGDPGVFSTSPFEFFNSPGIQFSAAPAGTAMPSFHFTLYFSTARVYAGVYDNVLIPYGVATALALASAEGHNHWVSDMVAGALIGTGIGNVILNNYDGRKREAMGMVVPIVSSKGVGAAFQMSF